MIEGLTSYKFYILDPAENMEESKLKKSLYLDDCRIPIKTIPGYEPWIVVKNYQEFVDYIKENDLPDLISFDHDLHEIHYTDYFNQVSKMGWQAPDYESYKEKTGLECAKWLCEYIQVNHIDWFPKTGCHSHNPVGAANIQSYINGFKKHMGWEQDCYLGKPEFIIEPALK